MKITTYNAHSEDHIGRSQSLVRQYRDNGYADGSRPLQRNCVIYSGVGRPHGTAAAWFGPRIIRVYFDEPPSAP